MADLSSLPESIMGQASHNSAAIILYSFITEEYFCVIVEKSPTNTVVVSLSGGFFMKWGAWVVVLAISGCSSVGDIEQTPATMSVISGKKPDVYAKCVVEKLAVGRDPAVIEVQEHGYKVIIAQSFSKSPAAVFDIEERSGGSSIKVHELLANMPLRPSDVRDAATQCISG